MDLALLWLFPRLAAAAPIQPLAWKLPYATDATLKRGGGLIKKLKLIKNFFKVKMGEGPKGAFDIVHILFL